MTANSNTPDPSTRQPDWPAPAVAWYAVGVLFLAYTVSIADRFILSLLIEPIKQDLNLSDTKVSLLHGFAFAIFFSVMGIPIARLADRFSRRMIIAAGVTVWSLMTAACGIANGYWQLFAARVGVGVGEAALSPPAYSMVADLFPPQKLGRALSFYTTGAYIGAGMVFIIGGMVLQAAMSTPEITLPVVGTIRSWQAAFFIVGVPGLAVALLMFTVPEPVRRFQANAAFSGDVQDPIPLRQVNEYMRQRWRVYGAHIFGFSFLAVIFNAIVAWTPAYLTRSFDLSIGQTGPAVGVLVLVFATAGIIVGGWLADRLVIRGYTDGAMRVGVIAGLGCIPFALLSLTVTSVTGILAMYGPLLFFSSFGFGAAAAALQQATPNRLRALVSAIYLFILNLIALGLGPTITASITDFVFRDDLAVGRSIACVAIVSGILSAFILGRGLKHFRAQVAAQAAN
ncbi:spinster family MFS transporter [Elongatibacter sediminis]|uniref:MFS transporter n=1 Tax=Elongatibacter sediminis TaxID=3119006 RepID=A0AAW9RM24_9GAMM